MRISLLVLENWKRVTVKLHVVPEAPGAIQKQRRVSIPLTEKFDQILDRWHTLDIIEDVGDEPTDWCSNVVLTPKKNGESVRASLDMTVSNKYNKRTGHTIPTLGGLETRLNGAKFFSHLDMNDGYMQLELAEESRKLTTFYTHMADSSGSKGYTLEWTVQRRSSMRRSAKLYPLIQMPSASTMTSWFLEPHRRNMTGHWDTSCNCGGATDGPFTWRRAGSTYARWHFLAKYSPAKESRRTLTRWQHCRQQARPNLKQKCDRSFS